MAGTEGATPGAGMVDVVAVTILGTFVGQLQLDSYG